MKRLLFLFAVLCSLCTWAQQHPSWRIAKPQQSEKWLGVMSESQANPLPTRSVGVLGTPAKAPEAVAAPQGEPYTYALTNINVSQAGMISVSGRADTLYVDGTTVYFRNLVRESCDGSYAVGTLTDGDMTNGTITFENGVEYAEGKHAYVGTVDANGYLVPNTEAESFTFQVVNGIISSVAPEETLGHFYLMGYTSAGGIAGYNIDYYYEPVPSDLQNTVIPGYVALETYEGVCEPLFGKSSKFLAYIGFDDDDVYFKNIIPGLGESVLKGKKVGAQIEIDAARYIGKYEDFYISFFSGNIQETVDETGETVVNLNIQPDDKIYLDYDEAAGTIKCNDVLVFLAGTTTLGGYWNKPAFSKYTVEPVTVPDDAEASRYSLTSRLLPEEGSERSSCEAWVLRDGGDFYFRNIYSPTPELAFKGTLNADGKSISVQLPQYMGVGSDGQPIQLAAASHDMLVTIPPSAVYSYVDSTATLNFKYDPDTREISYDGMLCTVVYGINQTITGLDYPVWTGQNDTLAVVPETAVVEDYMLKSARTVDYSRPEDWNMPVYVTSVARDGDMYYLHGFNEEYTEVNGNATMFGKREGGKITFDMPQLISNEGNNLIYAYVGDYDAESGKMAVSDANTLDFTIDEETGTISCDRSVVVRTSSGTWKYYYVNPAFIPYNPTPAKPKAPLPAFDFDVVHNGNSYSYAYTVQFYYEDVDGNYLAPDSLTYSMFMDGELYTFKNSFYWEEFTTDVTEVPMNMESSRFNMALMERRIWTPDQAESSIGFQVHYYCDGVKTSSDIVTMDIETGEITTTEVGVSDVTPADPTPERWRDRGQGRADFYVNVPEQDTNGNAIDVENLYYRIFMDDELYTFESIDYSDFSSDVTEVPASLNTSDFSKSGSEHLILLRDAPKEKIGIQSVYRSGDNVSYSKIGYYDIATGEVTYVDDPTTGVGATLTDKAVVKDVYYLPSGEVVPRPGKGLYIHKRIYSDGTSETTKVVIR